MLEREVGRVPELEREVAELRARLAEEERAEAILRRASGASAQRRPRPPGEATFLRVVRLVALAAIGAAVIAAATGHSGQVRHRAVPRCAVACHRLPGRQERAADLG
jgi:anti-sigma factor RsiW